MATGDALVQQFKDDATSFHVFMTETLPALAADGIKGDKGDKGDPSDVLRYADIYATAYAITDGEGRSVFDIDNAGNIRAGRAKALDDGTIQAIVDRDGNAIATTKVIGDREATDVYPYVITDSSGKVSFGIKSDGSVSIAKLEVDSITYPNQQDSLLSEANLSTEIAHFFCYGQSWSVGIGGVPAISTTQRFDNLSFNGGVRVQSISDDPAVVYTSLIPLVDDTGTPEFPTMASGETPTAGQTNMVKELLASENGLSTTDITYQLLGSAPGEGSKQLEQLSKPSDYYTRLITQVQYGYNLAQAAGKTYKVLALSWIQGGAIDDANYASLLEDLRADIDSDVKAITGQSEDVILITWQRFGSYTDNEYAELFYNRYVKAGEDYPNIYCSGPTYHLDPCGDGTIHLSSESNAWLGAYFGLVYKRVVIDGKDWQPLKPIGAFRQGRVLLVKFNPSHGPLTFDTTRVAEAENYGFDLYNSVGTRKTISSVSLVAPDTVKIVAAANFSATDRLYYGMVGSGHSRITGQRGNLRDSQGDSIVYDPSGANLPLHNWCVIFNKSISALEAL